MEIATQRQLLKSLVRLSGASSRTPPECPRSPSRSSSSLEAGWKVVLSIVTPPKHSKSRRFKKSPNFCNLVDAFSGHLGLFGHFFDTPGREAREHLLRLLGYFGRRGPRDSCIWLQSQHQRSFSQTSRGPRMASQRPPQRCQILSEPLRPVAPIPVAPYSFSNVGSRGVFQTVHVRRQEKRALDSNIAYCQRRKRLHIPEKFVGELISRRITYFFADLPLIRIDF